MILQVLYSTTIFLFKLSWLALLYHFFLAKWLFRATWAIGSLITAYPTVQIVCAVLHYVPIQTLWNPQVPGHCFNLKDVFILCGSFDIVADIAILCLPMPDGWELKVSKAKNAQLTFMFLLGGL